MTHCFARLFWAVLSFRRLIVPVFPGGSQRHEQNCRSVAVFAFPDEPVEAGQIFDGFLYGLLVLFDAHYISYSALRDLRI